MILYKMLFLPLQWLTLASLVANSQEKRRIVLANGKWVFFTMWKQGVLDNFPQRHLRQGREESLAFCVIPHPRLLWPDILFGDLALPMWTFFFLVLTRQLYFMSGGAIAEGCFRWGKHTGFFFFSSCEQKSLLSNP